MATSSSSTKRAARLAQRGRGQKVRFQGGTLFPLIVAIVVVLGFGLVIYARQSRPDAGASAPTVDDHWHHAYGFYLCDEWFQLSGNAEETDTNGNLVNADYRRTGVHSHEDGAIHWHAFSSAATGSRANLGVFLDVYDVELTDSKLKFPEEQWAGLPYEQETGLFEEGETKCVIDGEEENAELQAVVWSNYSDSDDGTTFIADFKNISLDSDAMVVAVAFVPSGTDVGKPPWAPELPELADAYEQQYDEPEDISNQTSTNTDSSSGEGEPTDTEAPAETDAPADE